MSQLEVDKIIPQSGTTVTLGDNGDTIAITSGASLTGFTSTGIDDNATSTAVTIDSSQNVGIGTGSPSQALDVVGSIEVSGNIYLGGTGSANALDDYEEGTWTPTYTASGGGSYNFTNNAGKYTKIGNLVTCTWWTQFSAPTGTLSGVLSHTGLPFTSNSQTRASAAFRIYGWGSGSNIIVNFTSNGTNINWQYYGSGGMSGILTNVPANWIGSGDEIGGTLTYQIS